MLWQLNINIRKLLTNLSTEIVDKNGQLSCSKYPGRIHYAPVTKNLQIQIGITG